jgi:hypothetical protein
MEVAPLRIVALDECEFPGAFPSLHLLFTQSRVGHGIVKLNVHEAIDSVPLGETRHGVSTMLEDATSEIGRHSDVKRAIATACEDVNAWSLFDHMFFARPGSLLSQGLRMIGFL